MAALTKTHEKGNELGAGGGLRMPRKGVHSCYATT